MAKRGRKPAEAASTAATGETAGQERGAKTRAVRAYLSSHRKAKPKEVVAALKEQGIEVSPNLVSILKAKSKIKKAHRKAAKATSNGTITPAQSGNSAALDAALLLFKSARGQEVPPAKVSQAFLKLVEVLG